MRRFWSVVLCLFLLLSLLPAPTASAASSLAQQIGLFIEKNGLSTETFSLSYSNLETRETCNYNSDMLLPMGDLWMMPLHMYFCEQESMGAFDPSFDRPTEVFTISGRTLKECRFDSLLLGKKEAAYAMQDYLGGHSSFKTLVNEAFGHMNEAALTDDYLNRNYFNTAFILNCLREMMEHPEIYDDLTRNYSLMQTADALAGFTGNCPVFQLQSQEDGWLTAAAKVWADNPYLLVCSIRAGEEGQNILAELNTMICSYVHQKSDTVHRPTASTEPRDLSIATTNLNRTGDMLRWIGIALGAALGIAAVIAIPVWIVRRKKDDRYYD